MKKITAFDKSNLDMIREDIKVALEAVAKKHGMILGQGLNIKYTSNTFKMGIEFGIEGSGDTPMVDPKLHNNMIKHGFKVGFSSKDLGAEVFLPTNGKGRIIGMVGYSKIAVQIENGTIFRVDPQSCRHYMKAAK